jgi:hypothetical protein
VVGGSETWWEGVRRGGMWWEDERSMTWQREQTMFVQHAERAENGGIW